MNEREAERIAAAVHVLRPDWPTSSLLTLLRKNLMDRPRRDVLVALAWVSAEPATSTPARVLESGPWWRAAAVDGDTTGRREPYNPAEFCDICGKPHGRHPEGDHVFVSVVEHTRALNADQAREAKRAAAKDYARQALGDAKAEGPREPEPREHKRSERVDELRAAMDAPPDDNQEAAMTEGEAGVAEVGTA